MVKTISPLVFQCVRGVMSSLVGKVHAQVLYLFCCVFLINLLFFGRLHRFFC